jgi:integrase
MTPSTGKRPFHFKNVIPRDPSLQRHGEWSHENRGFYTAFREWLKESGYGPSALNIYGVAARLAISFLRKPYWQIDPEADLRRVKEFLAGRRLRPMSEDGYRKGLNKFADYVRLRCQRPRRERQINWQLHIGSLSDALQQDVREFLQHCRHAWKPELRHERTRDKLYTLSRPLRWMAEHGGLKEIGDLTPQLWYAWLDQRLAAGINPKTVNLELSALKHFVHFLEDNARPVCARFLLVERLEQGHSLPRDVPLEQLRSLQAAILAESHASHAGLRRMGRMDLAWFLLMLHCGLRTGEIRNLQRKDIEWQARRVRIEQFKGLKDRLVYLSQAALEALKGYLEVRGPAEALPENVFIFRHAPLSASYCYQRLRTYGKCGGLRVHPHRLRHSCATLLLNAGAPALTVQSVLGHKQIDTTLGYARLYDGTVAADYYSAMNKVERQLALPEDRLAQPPSPGQLLALVDALKGGALNPAQTEIVWALRDGLSLLAEREAR